MNENLWALLKLDLIKKMDTELQKLYGFLLGGDERKKESD